jgi:hypothetical protein
MATRTTPPPTTAIRPAKMNLRQLSILAANSFDLRLEPHDLVAMVAVVHGGRPQALQDIEQPAWKRD